MPGKSLYTADTLSRSPLNDVTDKFSASSTETEQFVQAITAGLPANANRLEVYAKAQAKDRICSQSIKFCTTEWSKRNQLSRELRVYWKFQGSLTLSNTLLYQGHIVVPSSMQLQTLAKIHHGHQGIKEVDCVLLFQFGGQE